MKSFLSCNGLWQHSIGMHWSVDVLPLLPPLVLLASGEASLMERVTGDTCRKEWD